MLYVERSSATRSAPVSLAPPLLSPPLASRVSTSAFSLKYSHQISRNIFSRSRRSCSIGTKSLQKGCSAAAVHDAARCEPNLSATVANLVCERGANWLKLVKIKCSSIRLDEWKWQLLQAASN
jgi:hypothetical protein